MPLNHTHLNQISLRRQRIRAEGKQRLQEEAKAKNLEAKIVFPPSHLVESDHVLRTGVPWLYNGFLIYLPDLVMAVDPGVDFVYRLARGGIKIGQINTIFVSHGHLDHVGGVNTLSDFLIRAGQKTQLIAPKEVLEQHEVSPYHAGIAPHASGWQAEHFATSIEGETALEIYHGNYQLQTIPMFHGLPCYGFSLQYQSKKIVYISDTGYAKKLETNRGLYEVGVDKYDGEPVRVLEKHGVLKEWVKQSDYLIINAEDWHYQKKSRTHLTMFDVQDMLQGANPEKVILAHNNPWGELSYHEWVEPMLDYLHEETGLACVAPDAGGLKVSLV